jgi:hypothetical protein
MKSLASYVVAGLVSAFAAASALAGPSDAGAIFSAPQLAVAGPGPVTATFLGASQPFAQMFFGWDSSAAGFFFGSQTAPGTVFQESSQQNPVNPLGPGTDVTFAALFGTPGTTSAVLSSTGATTQIAAVLTAPGIAPFTPGPSILFNAGVIPTGADGALIGFNPPGAAMPSSFGGFAVRIAASNVCVR